MKRFASFYVLALLAAPPLVPAAIITVNTESVNGNPHQGATNLAYAISQLHDGDTIQFNIPNTLTNRHYLVSPSPSGYPVITNHNVTIDGYTQPGSSPNTNTILAANNAQIRIVLDARNGILSGYNPDPSGGYGAHELAVLFIQGTNCHIRGLCLLGPGQIFGVNDNYGVGVTYLADDTHVDGCWIGVDLDGQSIYPFETAVTAFGGPVGGVPLWPRRTVVGVQAGPADTAGARAQHNVFCGQHFTLDIESRDSRVSGNFFNVLPDGMHDVSLVDFPIESMMEFGRAINNLLIGTDGDGLNDAEERNVFGGVTAANDNNIIEFYGPGADPNAAVTNIVIAGNYFGLAVDGVTRFTNSMVLVDSFFGSENGIPGSFQFGSDLNGVSDAIEGNVIYMNNPFATLFPVPPSSIPRNFFNADAGAQVSVRGNTLVNNNLAPFSYANGYGSLVTALYNYDAPFMDESMVTQMTYPSQPGGEIIPILSSNSTTFNIIGACAPTNGGPYSNIFIDVYVLDPEGWSNGMLFLFSELTDSSTFTNGFAQGRTYLGTFVDNGPLDSDPAVGSFNFNAAGLGLAPGTRITVTANYSQDPPGTYHGRTHTSNFSDPVTLAVGTSVILSIRPVGNQVQLTWPAGTLQSAPVVTGPYADMPGVTSPYTTSPSGTMRFFRVRVR
jgi:hypothetical protein